MLLTCPCVWAILQVATAGLAARVLPQACDWSMPAGFPGKQTACVISGTSYSLLQTAAHMIQKGSSPSHSTELPASTVEDSTAFCGVVYTRQDGGLIAELGRGQEQRKEDAPAGHNNDHTPLEELPYKQLRVGEGGVLLVIPEASTSNSEPDVLLAADFDTGVDTFKELSLKNLSDLIVTMPQDRPDVTEKATAQVMLQHRQKTVIGRSIPYGCNPVPQGIWAWVYSIRRKFFGAPPRIPCSKEQLLAEARDKEEAFHLETDKLQLESQGYVAVNGSVFQSSWNIRKNRELVVCFEEASEDSIQRGHLHDVVGKDGVLMLTLDGLESRQRSAVTEAGLAAAGIVPQRFSATDAKKASEEELARACMPAASAGTGAWCKANDKPGEGCRSHNEQAIADSHRRALEVALHRNSTAEWTAIFEDDVTPVWPENWNENFRKAWASIPPETKMVRLGWCVFEEDVGHLTWEIYGNTGEFKLVRGTFRPDGSYYSGGCTTGYLVHRSFIPVVLNLFPCCCPLDCCLEWGLFNKPTPPGIRGPKGLQVMMSIDNAGSIGHTPLNWAHFNQSGILLQDLRRTTSTRPGCMWSWILQRIVCEERNPDLMVYSVFLLCTLAIIYRMWSRSSSSCQKKQSVYQ